MTPAVGGGIVEPAIQQPILIPLFAILPVKLSLQMIGFRLEIIHIQLCVTVNGAEITLADAKPCGLLARLARLPICSGAHPALKQAPKMPDSHSYQEINDQSKTFG
jgi:hypothetical protein